MNTTYTGFYTRFDTLSKKDAAPLLGADNLVGDIFEIVFEKKDGEPIACLKNRFGMLVGFLDLETTQRLRILDAREWILKALLSFVAYTDTPEPGHYWGEVALLCYSAENQTTFETFTNQISHKLTEGIRPEIDIGDQAIAQLLQLEGKWEPKQRVPFPEKKTGTVIMKSRRKLSEKVIEQGRSGRKGCYIASWAFLFILAAGLFFFLRACGAF